ncbi:sulfotransferase family protein [Wenxinia marina]|uniref:Branched-chain amino acid aminotransferase n=2 Tax=Wenxinia TaxID=653686 RepID=A0A0D0PI23_9RHOB|nr:hypothetical protein Wenmar_00419 [Wenxinia marina DSM 24838]GGL55344.1 branched chain amino acid aminotransferase [Wenxinia marina]
MLYAFGNRADFAVLDEPFYAAYLAATGLDHPMREEVLAAQPTDPAIVARQCGSDPVPGKKPHLYMKHMAQHMLPGFPLDWTAACTNVHLIRHPARVVASYAAKRERPTLDDIGYARHAALFERFPGPVLDSADIRADPEGMLRRLCAEIGLTDDPAMLSWAAGPKPWDGVWASHWYGAVHLSTGFSGAEGPLPTLDGGDARLVEEALPFYEAMRSHALCP